MHREEYGRLYAAEESLWWYRGLRALLTSTVSELVKGKPEARILDAGCGTGGNLVQLQAFGRATGIDLSMDALGFARQRNPQQLVRGSVLELPFRSASFNVVTSMDVLYHQWVVDDVEAMRELHRVLRPGGALVVHVAALELFRGPHDVVVQTRERYTRASLKGKLQRAGFKVERITYRNSLLSPVLLVRRLLSVASDESGSDVSIPSPVVNGALTAVQKLENAMLRVISFPFGSSLFAVARKAD